ncbi:sarcolemmal membrane-associated protein-like [Anabrus simplex]|uniref:sarcolemmal membrane-associated protein-like n=1 Tax=Anabrus simplex TaxID=316456 RepID=UPI0035A285C8
MVVALSGDCLDDVPYPGNSSKMTARATLTCRPNSHPFQERNLNLAQPVKIGRSVAHARPALNNAIFDCKVLSRNHALVWYEENKFYLQDTKSSNGTFVNNQRLSKGSEESPPREVFSGDIVQFGVDVMENTRKVTHGCIVATLKLYHPDGKEAKTSPSTSVSSFGMVPLDDLYQLNQYLNDSLQREQLLEKKLASLQKWVESTSEASELCWKALIDEDRLLSRVENLENQLQIYSKNFPEDKLRDELRKLQEDKNRYEEVVKESIRKMLLEKTEAVQKYEDLERLLSNRETECAQLQKLKESGEQDLQELAQKYNQQLHHVDELSLKLLEREEEGREACERLEQDKLELAARLEEQHGVERALQARLDAVSKDGELRRRQLAVLQSRIVAMQTERLEDDVARKYADSTTKPTDSTGIQVDISPENIELGETIVEDNTEKEIERLRCQLKKSEDHLKENQEKVDELNLRLDESRTQERVHTEMTEQMEGRLQELKLELSKLPPEAEMDENSLSNEANKLKMEIVRLEELLNETRGKEREAGSRVLQIQLELDKATLKVRENEEELSVLKQQMQEVQTFVAQKSTAAVQQEAEMQKLASVSGEMKQQVVELREKLQAETQRADRQAETVEILKKQLLDAQQAAVESHIEVEHVKDHLLALQQDSTAELIHLRGECGTLQKDISRLKEEYALLEEKHNGLEASQVEIKKSIPVTVQQPDENLELAAELENYRKMHAEDCKKVESLEEQLVVVKERYLQCNEEMAQLSKDLNNLRQEYGNLATITYAVPVKYLIPIVVALAALIIASGLFDFF